MQLELKLKQYLLSFKSDMKCTKLQQVLPIGFIYYSNKRQKFKSASERATHLLVAHTVLRQEVVAGCVIPMHLSN